jgi:hypothetical protein
MSFPDEILPIHIVSEPDLALAVCLVREDSKIQGVNVLYRYPRSAEPKRMSAEVARDVFGIQLLKSSNERQHLMLVRPIAEPFTLHNLATPKLTYPFVSDGKTGVVKGLEVDIHSHGAQTSVTVKVMGEFRRSATDAPIQLSHTIQASETFVNSVRLWLEKRA